MYYNSQNTPPPYNSGGNSYPAYKSAQTIVQETSQVMKRVYLKMTLAMIVTALVSLACASSPSFIQFFYGNPWVYWGSFIAMFGMAILIPARINKMSSGTVTLLFYIFAALMGLSLSGILLVYTGASIAKTFFICAATFGGMSVYGYFTTQDLSTWGKYLMYALWGLVVAMLVNIFTKSATFDYIISIIGVLLFVGLTAWDTQSIKRMAAVTPSSEVSKLATIGAMNLYLDFINLFLYLLRLFGSRRN